MKKILSLALALLMLALPVMSLAEEETVNANLVDKYLSQGQALTVRVQIEPGEVLIGSLPEEMQTPVQELLEVAKLLLVTQRSGDQSQGSLRLKINDEMAAEATVALGEGGLYVASSFLGDKIYQVTPEQLQQLADDLIQAMVADGSLTQEQVDAFRAALADPEAALASLIGDVDPTALLMAVAELFNFDQEMAEVTEVPEGVTIDAKYVATITLKKDALRNVTTELAKLLWGMPVVQQIAPSVTLNETEPLTEESLTAALNAIPDALAQDVEIKVYLTEDYNQIQALAEVQLILEGQQVPMKVNVLIIPTEDGGVQINWQSDMEIDEQNSFQMKGDMLVQDGFYGQNVNYTIETKVKENGVEYTPITETISMLVQAREGAQMMTMNVLVRAQEEPGAEPVGIIYEIESLEQDILDHVEGTTTVKVALENVGDLVTVKVAEWTDLAEAYIITEDAVKLLDMSEEELYEEFNNGATAGTFTLLSKLPASVLNLILNTQEQ